MMDAGVKRATYADIEAAPEGVIAEILSGQLVTHPPPARRHVTTAAALTVEIATPFQKGLGGPGGWIFAEEPELHLADDVLVPDLAGWKYERLNGHPDTNFFSTPPDWICEILSASTESRDRTIKMQIYGSAGVSYVWLVDPRQQLLEAFELTSDRWTRLGGWRGETQVSVAPFDAISFSLANLWPLDKPLGFNESPQALYAGDR